MLYDDDNLSAEPPWWRVRTSALARLSIDLKWAFGEPLEPATVATLHGSLRMIASILEAGEVRPRPRVVALAGELHGYEEEDEDSYLEEALYVEALIAGAVDAHEFASKDGPCGCGGTASCERDGTGLIKLLALMSALAIGDGWDGWAIALAQRMFEDELQALAPAAAETPEVTSEVLGRDELDRRLIEVLRAHRSELRTRDLIARIPGATSAQVGGRLRSLESRGLVEIQRYRNPRNGYETNAWCAVFP